MPEQATDTSFLDSLKPFPGLASSSYEFPADRQMLETLNSLYPVKILAQWLIKFQLSIMHGEHLGRAVKVTPKQFKDLHRLQKKAAEILDMKAPDLFVTQNPYTNAYTVGIDADNVFIVLTSGLVDLMDERELLFVIGHEMGHIKSNHTLFHTMANAISQGMRMALPPIINVLMPLALLAWQRRSEITCDRAGLLCCQDERVAMQSMVKIALGSQKLLDQIDLDEFLAQVREIESSLGQYNELFVSHPYLPKRVRALQLFAQGELYSTKIRNEYNEYLRTDDMDTMVADLLFSSKYGKENMQPRINNEDVLSLLGVMAVAWSEGILQTQERDAISDLINEYQIEDESAKFLQGQFQERVTIDQIESLLPHFTGERENIFYTALEFAYEPEIKLTRRRKNTLYRLGELCDIDSLKVMKAVNERERLSRARP